MADLSSDNDMLRRSSDGNDGSTNSYCIFQEPWWLNLVTEGNWDEAIVENGGIAARLPYQMKRRRGFKVMTQPPFTPILGPWFRASNARDAKNYSDQYAHTRELLSQLPKFDLFCQNFWPELTNWLPFYWAGFTQTTVYTYWFRELSNPEAIWQGFRPSARGQIRGAEKKVTVHIEGDIDLLCDQYERTFVQQGKAIPYGRQVLRRIADGAVRAGRGRISVARDTDGNVHAICFLVFDGRTAHYLVGASDDRFRGSGAMSLLIWDAIQFAATQSMIFDFEGSMVESVERFFRTFNPTLVPINRVFKIGKLLGALIEGRNAVASLIGRPPLRI